MKRLHKTACLAAVLAAVGVWTPARAQDPPAAEAKSDKITFRAPAATLASLLPNLSKQAGVTLTATRSTAGVVVLLQVKDVTLADLMKRIADATGASWEKDETGYRLNRTTEQARAQAKEENALRAAALQKALDPYIKALTKPAGSGTTTSTDVANEMSVSVTVGAREQGAPADVQRRTFASGGSGSNAITKLIQLIGVGNIAALAPDTRTVYSTGPTRMQRALPFAAGRIIQDFVQEARMQAQPPVETTPERGRGRRNGAPQPPNPQSNLDAPPAKAVLVVSRMGFGDMLQFQLIVADAEGRTMVRGDMMLAPRPAPRGTADVAVSNADKVVELPAATMEYAKLMQTTPAPAGVGGDFMVQGTFRVVVTDGDGGVFTSGDDVGKTPEVSKEWRERLINPETNEPLSFCAGPALGLAADGAGLNIVAVIPDSSLAPAVKTIVGSQATVGRIVAAAQTDWGLKAVKDGGWLVLSPRLPDSAYDFRLDRAALGKALKLLASKGILSLDQRAAYAAAEPIAPPEANFESAYFKMINSGEARRIAGGTLSGERKMLRFYSTLGLMSRQSLGAGRGLALSSLNFGQRDLLADMVFNSFDGPMIGSPNQGPGGRRQMLTQRFGDLASERTEMLPTGIPGAGVLTVEVTNRPTVFGVGSSGDRVALDGPRITFANADGQNQLSATAPQYELYTTGKQNVYTFLFRLAQNVTFRRSLTDSQVDNAKPVPYDKLPPEARQRLEQMQRNIPMIINTTRGGGGPVRP